MNKDTSSLSYWQIPTRLPPLVPLPETGSPAPHICREKMLGISACLTRESKNVSTELEGWKVLKSKTNKQTKNSGLIRKFLHRNQQIIQTRPLFMSKLNFWQAADESSRHNMPFKPQYLSFFCFCCFKKLLLLTTVNTSATKSLKHISIFNCSFQTQTHLQAETLTDIFCLEKALCH